MSPILVSSLHLRKSDHTAALREPQRGEPSIDAARRSDPAELLEFHPTWSGTSISGSPLSTRISATVP